MHLPSAGRACLFSNTAAERFLLVFAGLIPALGARVSEAEQEASTAQVALAEHVKGLGPDKGHMGLAAVVSTLLSELQGIAVGLLCCCRRPCHFCCLHGIYIV